MKRRGFPGRGTKGTDETKGLFRRHGGFLSTTEAIRLGVHPRTLYGLRDARELEPMGRGLYRLSELSPLDNPDLVTVSLRIPTGVVCLISALSFHDLTTEIPHQVYVALARGSERPRIAHPPVRFFWFGESTFEHGVETHKVDGFPLRIYSAEKTLADCFKFRNRIGKDTVIEALKLYRERRRPKVDDLVKFARLCRVERIMRPYLEALL